MQRSASISWFNLNWLIESSQSFESPKDTLAHLATSPNCSKLSISMTLLWKSLLYNNYYCAHTPMSIFNATCQINNTLFYDHIHFSLFSGSCYGLFCCSFHIYHQCSQSSILRTTTSMYGDNHPGHGSHMSHGLWGSEEHYNRELWMVPFTLRQRKLGQI